VQAPTVKGNKHINGLGPEGPRLVQKTVTRECYKQSATVGAKQKSVSAKQWNISEVQQQSENRLPAIKAAGTFYTS
jgi:hypothetical protein